MLEKGELSEEDFGGLVKAEERFQKVRSLVVCRVTSEKRPKYNMVFVFLESWCRLRFFSSRYCLRELRLLFLGLLTPIADIEYLVALFMVRVSR